MLGFLRLSRPPPLAKVAEMNQKKKKMVERTRSSLLDAAANSEEAATMEESLKLARKNGALNR